MLPKHWLLRSRKTQAVPETGEFACPACSVDREYELLITNETYGLLDRFLPGSRGDIALILVQCKTCDRRFPDEVRDRTLYRDRDTERETVKRLRENLRPQSVPPEQQADSPDH